VRSLPGMLTDDDDEREEGRGEWWLGSKILLK
jgi:hypothetical protein